MLCTCPRSLCAKQTGTKRLCTLLYTLPFLLSFFLLSFHLLSVPPFFSPSLHPLSSCFPALFPGVLPSITFSVDSSLLLSFFLTTQTNLRCVSKNLEASTFNLKQNTSRWEPYLNVIDTKTTKALLQICIVQCHAANQHLKETTRYVGGPGSPDIWYDCSICSLSGLELYAWLAMSS